MRARTASRPNGNNSRQFHVGAGGVDLVLDDCDRADDDERAARGSASSFLTRRLLGRIRAPPLADDAARARAHPTDGGA